VYSTEAESQKEGRDLMDRGVIVKIKLSGHLAPSSGFTERGTNRDMKPLSLPNDGFTLLSA
jgi:hypothetical protein